MLKVALTGGIATGKSHVLALLRDRGVPVIDADDIVHELFEADTPTSRAVALEFGDGILEAGGRVNRAVLGAKVFADAGARMRLEALVHPIVYDRIRAWFATPATSNRPMGVASIPLLYETHREGDFDAVVVTTCDASQQLQRLTARGLSEAEARLRLAAQMSAEEKAQRGDYVIWTGGTLQETEQQAENFIEKVRSRK